MDDTVEPVLEICERYDAPQLVHPKPFESLVPGALDETYQLNSIFGREIALAESMSKVVHDGILDCYPDLKLVHHHLGGNKASMLGRIHLRPDDGRWPRQEHVKPYSEFKRQLEQLYVDTSGFFGYRSLIRNTLEEFPSSQVVFGTDAPYEPRNADKLSAFAEAIRDVTSVHDSRRVLTTNASELLVNT